MKVVIKSLFHSPRLSYISQWLKYRWEVDVELNTNHGQDDVLITYGAQDTSNDSFTIPSVGLLEHRDIIKQDHTPTVTDELNLLFPVEQEEYDLSFDFFSMAFYLLSRYEEYTHGSKDQHNRWKSDQAVAVKHLFIELPVLDMWLYRIQSMIEVRFGIKLRSSSKFTIVPTIDIDLPYAYKKKQWKNVAALVRDTLTLKWGKTKDRLVYLTNGVDPFDQYDYLLDQLSVKLETIFFFLCKYQKPYDENHLVNKPIFGELVKRIAEEHKIGIHPSYSSGDQTDQIAQEINHLKGYSDHKIIRSRQHFLRLNLPTTYRNLIELGIEEDHSMIHPDQLGFRASTCHPFFWYDLENERTTSLLIHSPCIMDVTLKDYCKLSPEEAISQINKLKSVVSLVDGRLEFIWHNSSFSDLHGWTGWQKVFEYLLSD